MKGIYLGMFALCIFMLLITVNGFASGEVSIFYPLANLGAAVLCAWKMR